MISFMSNSYKTIPITYVQCFLNTFMENSQIDPKCLIYIIHICKTREKIKLYETEFHITFTNI